MTLSDSRNKARALVRIKRLASSGLPLEPFVRSIFELINDAVPSSPNRAIHVGGKDADAYICTPEVGKIIPLHHHYFVSSPSELSGAKYRMNLDTIVHLLPTKTIWLQEDFFTPNLYRAEGFNEAYRPLGWHHMIGTIYHDVGEYLGYFGMWRSADQKPYSREEIEFLSASAPHIAHGLRAAQLLARDSSSDADSFAPVTGWGSGVILTDPAGKPIAMDVTARLIFQQLGVFDGLQCDAFASRPLQAARDYITRCIFRDADGSLTAAAPVYRIYHHWTGIVLKLRGVRMIASDGREYTTVLIERGETAEARRRRVCARWGLSRREAQILSFIGAGKTGPEIAILLGISHDTVRKHTTSILDKLCVETRTAAAVLMRDANDA